MSRIFHYKILDHDLFCASISSSPRTVSFVISSRSSKNTNFGMLAYPISIKFIRFTSTTNTLVSCFDDKHILRMNEMTINFYFSISRSRVSDIRMFSVKLLHLYNVNILLRSLNVSHSSRNFLYLHKLS